MNKLEVEVSKIKKQITKVCRKKHGDVKVNIYIECSDTKPRLNIHVWKNNEYICLYTPNTVKPKQVAQYIRHNDGFK